LPKYIPLVIEPELKAGLSDLLELHWDVKGIRATFLMPDANTALEVSFAGQCVVRILDEMPLSTEADDSPNEGLVPDRFAYHVEGALFFRMQSDAFKETVKVTRGSCNHYRFITGGTCLDVVTGAEPSFAVVARTGGSD
jgi:hypothetical protein